VAYRLPKPGIAWKTLTDFDDSDLSIPVLDRSPQANDAAPSKSNLITSSLCPVYGHHFIITDLFKKRKKKKKKPDRANCVQQVDRFPVPARAIRFVSDRNTQTSPCHGVQCQYVNRLLTGESRIIDAE